MTHDTGELIMILINIFLIPTILLILMLVLLITKPKRKNSIIKLTDQINFDCEKIIEKRRHPKRQFKLFSRKD